MFCIIIASNSQKKFFPFCSVHQWRWRQEKTTCCVLLEQSPLVLNGKYNHYHDFTIGHFRIHSNRYFKMGQSAKSLLWISVFIHGEIRANCHKKIPPRLARELENGLLARVIPRVREIDFSWLWKFSLLSAFSMTLHGNLFSFRSFMW